jgi:hypothetical protein
MFFLKGGRFSGKLNLHFNFGAKNLPAELGLNQSLGKINSMLRNLINILEAVKKIIMNIISHESIDQNDSQIIPLTTFPAQI